MIESWIDNLGEVKKIEPIIVSDTIQYFDKNFELSWINNTKYFSEKLSNKLKFIENNRYQGKQFYFVQNNYSNGTLNENYNDFNWKEKNHRILALFRYWNIVEYFFPYKYLMDNKWDKTLEDMLTNFIEAQTENQFQIAALKLVTRLNDSHSSYYFFTKHLNYTGGGRRFLPVNCKIIDNKLIVTQILSDAQAKLDDLKIGDVITKVNNKTIEGIIAERRDFIPASNNAYYLKELVSEITSGFFDSIEIEMIRYNKIIKKTIVLTDYRTSHLNEYRKKKVKIEKYKIIKNNIGYVDMGRLKTDEIAQMMTELNNTKAIIFDIRNYPKETYEISNYLNSKEKEFAKYTNIDLTYPGRFIFKYKGICGKENKNNYKGKVIVLLNEFSKSQSEWTAMIFKTADNCTIIGSQTAGADGNVSNIGFVNDKYAPFSGVGVYYPDGRETQRIGIIPDIQVKPTIKGIQKGKDEVLNRAIEFVKKGK